MTRSPSRGPVRRLSGRLAAANANRCPRPVFPYRRGGGSYPRPGPRGVIRSPAWGWVTARGGVFPLSAGTDGHPNRSLGPLPSSLLDFHAPAMLWAIPMRSAFVGLVSPHGLEALLPET